MSADSLVAKMNDVLNRVFELEKQGKYHEAAEYQAMMLVKVQQEFKAQQVWQPLKQFLQCKLPPLPFNALGCNLCGWQFHIQREPMQHQVARRRQSMSKARMSLRMSVSEVGTRQSRRSVTDWLPSSLDTRLRSLSDAVINAPVGGPAVAPLSVLDKGTQALCALLLDGEATGYEALDPTSLSDAFEIGLLAVVGALGKTLALVVKNDEGNLGKLRAATKAAATADSLEALLVGEIARGDHTLGAFAEDGVGARLADPSAAMALLWLMRTLKFIVRLFELLADESATSPPGVGQAMMAAYSEVLKPYHKWPMRATFDFVAKQAPSYAELIGCLSAPGAQVATREASVLAAMRAYVTEAGYPLIVLLEELFVDLRLEDVRAA